MSCNGILGISKLVVLYVGIIGKPVKGDTYEKCTSSDCSGKVSCTTIYQHRDFGGWYQCLTLKNNDDCITLNSWWIGGGSRVSGANTHGTCVRLHELPGCQGLSIEVKPGSPSHRYLNELNFEDTARSVSTCGRTTYNPECTVQTLFSPKIDTSKVSKASSEILDVVDGLAGLAVSGFSLAIPGIDLFYDGLKFITGLFSSEQSTEALIDAKIEEAFARNSASQIAAKMHIIQNRLEVILSKSTLPADRRSDLGLALHTCEEVQRLFHDKNYSFSQNKLVSSPYLVAFSSVYLSVARMVYDLRPEMRSRVTRDIRELATLNQDFQREAVKRRKEQFSWGYVSAVAYRVKDELVCKHMWNDRGKVRAECGTYKFCVYFPYCERCLEEIKTTIEKKFDQFFQPIIKKLHSFP